MKRDDGGMIRRWAAGVAAACALCGALAEPADEWTAEDAVGAAVGIVEEARDEAPSAAEEQEIILLDAIGTTVSAAANNDAETPGDGESRADADEGGQAEQDGDTVLESDEGARTDAESGTVAEIQIAPDAGMAAVLEDGVWVIAAKDTDPGLCFVWEIAGDFDYRVTDAEGAALLEGWISGDTLTLEDVEPLLDQVCALTLSGAEPATGGSVWFFVESEGARDPAEAGPGDEESPGAEAPERDPDTTDGESESENDADTSSETTVGPEQTSGDGDSEAEAGSEDADTKANGGAESGSEGIEEAFESDAKTGKDGAGDSDGEAKSDGDGEADSMADGEPDGNGAVRSDGGVESDSDDSASSDTGSESDGADPEASDDEGAEDPGDAESDAEAESTTDGSASTKSGKSGKAGSSGKSGSGKSVTSGKSGGSGKSGKSGGGKSGAGSSQSSGSATSGAEEDDAETELALPDGPVTALSVGEGALALSLDEGKSAFVAALGEDGLTLTPAESGDQWRVSGAALRTLAETGIARVTFAVEDAAWTVAIAPVEAESGAAADAIDGEPAEADDTGTADGNADDGEAEDIADALTWIIDRDGVTLESAGWRHTWRNAAEGAATGTVEAD